MAQSFVYTDDFKNRYQVIGLVETHYGHERLPDLQARATAMGFNSVANPAMNYVLTQGNHGGEAILTAKHTFSLPIDPIILEAAQTANLEVPRFTASEVRYGQTSILTIIAYFLCSEGLSPRNFGILQQISPLIKQFKVPFFVVC